MYCEKNRKDCGQKERRYLVKLHDNNERNVIVIVHMFSVIFSSPITPV